KTEDNQALLIMPHDKVTVAGAVGLPLGAKLQTAGHRVLLHLPKGTPATTFKLVLWSGNSAELSKFGGLLDGEPGMVDFAKGGPAHWPQDVVTKGVLATSKTPDGAYVTDSLTPPIENPWKRRVRFGGLDFFS